MEVTRHKTAWQIMAFVGITLTTMVAWYCWLGWDRTRDVHPDGSTTGPYEAWQVIGLIVTLLVPMVWATIQRYSPAAVAGITIGLTVAAYYDWSDDASGLYAIGVGMIMIGAVVMTTLTAVVVSALANRAGRNR